MIVQLFLLRVLFLETPVPKFSAPILRQELCEEMCRVYLPLVRFSLTHLLLLFFRDEKLCSGLEENNLSIVSDTFNEALSLGISTRRVKVAMTDCEDF